MNLFSLFWGVGLFLHPYILRISTAHGARIGKDTFVYLLICMSICFFSTKPVGNILEKYIFGFLLFLGFYNQFDFLAPSVFYQFIFFSSFIALIFHWYGNYSKEFENTILNMLVISGLAHTTWEVAELFYISPYTLYAETFLNVKAVKLSSDIAGVLNNGNISGAYIALCLPATFRKNGLWAIPILLLGVFLSGSAMAVVTTIGICLYYFWSRLVKKLKLLPYAGALGVIILFYILTPRGQLSIDSYRFEIWEMALSVFGDSYIFGNGLGWFAETFHNSFRPYKMVIIQEHNELLSIYFAFGVAGLASMYLLLSRAVKSTNPIMLAGLFGVFVNSLGNFTFHVTTLAAIACFYYVACMHNAQRSKYV